MPRFSLKWMLFGVTYVAIAAAACSQQHKLWDQFLWLLTGSLVLYAVLAAIFLRGRGQAVALGFALFAIVLGLGIKNFPDASPVNYVGYAMGLNFPVTSGSEYRETLRYELMIARNASNRDYRERVDKHAEKYESLVQLSSSINAIGVTLAGLIGCLLGGFIWTSAQKQQGG